MNSTAIYTAKSAEPPKAILQTGQTRSGGKDAGVTGENSFLSMLQEYASGGDVGPLAEGSHSLSLLQSPLLMGQSTGEISVLNGEKSEEQNGSAPGKEEQVTAEENMLLAGLLALLNPNMEMGKGDWQDMDLPLSMPALGELMSRLQGESAQGSGIDVQGGGKEKDLAWKVGEPLLTGSGPERLDQLFALLKSITTRAANGGVIPLLEGKGLSRSEGMEILSSLGESIKGSQNAISPSQFLQGNAPNVGTGVNLEAFKQVLTFLANAKQTAADSQFSTTLANRTGTEMDQLPSTNREDVGISLHSAAKEEGDLSKAGFHQLLGSFVGKGDPQQASITQQVPNSAPFQERLTHFMLTRIRLTRFPDGTSEARLKLFPESLGSIDVKIAMQHGVMQALFIAETAQGKELLEQSMNHLRQQLAQQGIQVDKMEILTPQKDLQQGISWQQQGEDRRGKQNPSFHWKREPESEEDFSTLFDGRIS